MYEKFKLIDTFIFDVDGVMTDGTMLITEAGELLRIMNVRDGFALQLAQSKGYKIIVITGGNSAGVTFRLQKLGITHVFSGISDKLKLLKELEAAGRINLGTSAYMGDDLLDQEAMEAVLLAVAPRDAVPDILQIAEYITSTDGGKGCVRELIEKTLRVQGNWFVRNQKAQTGA